MHNLFLSLLFFLLPFNFIDMQKSYETQPYQVLEQIDNFELRYYPPALKVKTTSPDPRLHFQKLFGYISGKNSSETKIAMTTPVYMQKEPNSSEMAFVLPSEMTLENSPAPKDTSVKVVKDPGGYFCSLRYGGYSNSTKEAQFTAELLRRIHEKNLTLKGNPWVLGYDSPFKFYQRTNEILIQVESPYKE